MSSTRTSPFATYLAELGVGGSITDSREQDYRDQNNLHRAGDQNLHSRGGGASNSSRRTLLIDQGEHESQIGSLRKELKRLVEENNGLRQQQTAAAYFGGRRGLAAGSQRLPLEGEENKLYPAYFCGGIVFFLCFRDYFSFNMERHVYVKRCLNYRLLCLENNQRSSSTSYNPFHRQHLHQLLLPPLP